MVKDKIKKTSQMREKEEKKSDNGALVSQINWTRDDLILYQVDIG